MLAKCPSRTFQTQLATLPHFLIISKNGFPTDGHCYCRPHQPTPPPSSPCLTPPQDPGFGADEADSPYGDNVTLSTASITSTIFQYRKLHGRTYHNFDGGEREYWCVPPFNEIPPPKPTDHTSSRAPNDAKQNEQLDLK